MAFRFYGSIPEGVKADLFPFMEKVFMTVGTATVSTSAEEAKSYGFLRRTDRITLNPDAVLVFVFRNPIAASPSCERRQDPMILQTGIINTSFQSLRCAAP